MDDYLTIFGDGGPGGGKKFEDAQSKFNRMHVPRQEVQWTLCDFCGMVVSKELYNDHIVQHELIGITYAMYHFDISEEQKQLELVARIQKNEAERAERQRRRNLGIEDQSTSSSSSSSSSSDSALSSSDESGAGEDDERLSESTGYSTASSSSKQLKRKKPIDPMLMRNKKKMQSSNNKIAKGNKLVNNKNKKMFENSNPSSQSGIKKSVHSIKDGVARRIQFKKKIGQMRNRTGVRGKMIVSPEAHLDMVTTNPKPTTGKQHQDVEPIVMEEDGKEEEREEEGQRKIALDEDREKKREEIRQRKKLQTAWKRKQQYEEELMKLCLGPNHHRVYIDNSAALETYFDRKTGNIKLEAMVNPPPIRRRSLRGARMENSEDEPCCLVW